MVVMNNMPRIVLASASPRRRELLRLIVPRFEVIASSFDESKIPLWPPQEHVLKSSCVKASEVAAQLDDAIVIGADTVVVVGLEVLGKPRDNEDARRMLRLLSGRCHYVYTGVTVVKRGNGRTEISLRDFARTRVRFCKLRDAVIDAYIATGEPLDKAGAYGIQEKGCVLVEKICGDYFTVVGLPVFRLSRLLQKIGVPLFSDPP